MAKAITGVFKKQVWGGRKGNDACFVSEESFDATNSVLLLPLKKIHFLDDADESSDRIGSDNVDWDGPFEVIVVDSIKEFFGVDDLEDITQEMLDTAKSNFGAIEPETKTVTLTIHVTVKAAPGTSLGDFVSELDYTIRSQTSGIVVVGTEITESESDDDSE